MIKFRLLHLHELTVSIFKPINAEIITSDQITQFVSFTYYIFKIRWIIQNLCFGEREKNCGLSQSLEVKVLQIARMRKRKQAMLNREDYNIGYCGNLKILCTMLSDYNN